MTGAEWLELINKLATRISGDQVIEIPGSNSEMLVRDAVGDLSKFALPAKRRSYVAESLEGFVTLVAANLQKIDTPPVFHQQCVLVSECRVRAVLDEYDRVCVTWSPPLSEEWKALPLKASWTHRDLMKAFHGVWRRAVSPDVVETFAAIRVAKSDVATSHQQVSKSTLGRTLSAEMVGEGDPLPEGFILETKVFALKDCPQVIIPMDVWLDVEDQKFVLTPQADFMTAAVAESCAWLAAAIAEQGNEKAPGASIPVLCGSLA